MQKLLSPCADPIFKALFTDNSPEARNALTSLLESILEQDVSDVQLLPNELSEECIGDRQTIFDISCLLNKTEPVNIEMQGVNFYESFNKRVEYHAAHLLNHIVKKGITWDKIPKSYQISVLNFIYDDKHNDISTHYYMKADNGSKLAQRLNVFFIELPKVLEITDDISQLSKTQMWAKYFSYADREDKQDFVKKLTNKMEGIMDAQTVLSRISLDDAMWLQQKQFFNEYNHEATIKSESFDKGLHQGRTEGLAQGRTEGSHNEKIETARKMLKFGESIEKISIFTDLSIEEIQKLQH